jgi:hypothetical protein
MEGRDGGKIPLGRSIVDGKILECILGKQGGGVDWMHMG